MGAHSRDDKGHDVNNDNHKCPTLFIPNSQALGSSTYTTLLGSESECQKTSDGNFSSYLIRRSDMVDCFHFLWAEMEIILNIYPPK